MPIAIAVALRFIVLSAVSYLAFALIEEYGLPFINGAIAKIMVQFGVDEQTATDIMANRVLVAFEEIGIFAATLKTKLPVKIAERLGFTSKGFAKRILPASVASKLPAAEKIMVKATAATTAEVEAVAEITAKTRGVSKGIVMSTYLTVVATIGATTYTLSTIGNWIDFGNWNSGAYQKLAQRVFAVISFGLIVPDPKVPKSDVLSSDVWNRAYSVYMELGAVGINDPYKLQTVMFSRQNLIDLVDKIAAASILEGKTVGLKQIISLTTILVIVKDMNAAVRIADAGGISTATPTATGTKGTQISERSYVAAPIVQQVKVFTGVVSQGVLGSTATFTPRPDDLIENADELTQASHNNLAPFIAALGTRLSYEIKVVSSVTNAQGFTQRGTAQRIVSGYNKDGSPKYRTVVNKFATMDIYVRTDRGTQTKITTIVLGPVDSVKFQNANVNLGAVAVDVKQNIIAPTTSAAPVTTPAAIPVVPISAQGVFQDHNPPLFATLYKIVDGSRWSYSPYSDLYTEDEKQKLLQDPNKFAGNEQKLKERGVITTDVQIVPFIADKQPGETKPERGISTFAEFFGATPSFATPTPETAQVATGATTLFEYYQSQGKTLPSVEERSKLYEQLALGQAAYYTGTAEQNTKLLAALQGVRL